MRTRRGSSSRGKMVNYAQVLVVALAVTSLVLLVKYRNLTLELAQTEKNHIITKKALEDDLGKEAQRYKELNNLVDQHVQEKADLNNRLKNTQDELSNSVNALQESNGRIEALNLEKQSLVEELNKVKEEKDELQTLRTSLQEELNGSYSELQKMQATVDAGALTLKDAQEIQEKLMSENTKLTQQIAEYQVLQGENENLRVQLQGALNEAKTAVDKVAELEARVTTSEKKTEVTQNIKEEKTNKNIEKLEKKDTKQAVNDKANGDQQKPESEDKGKDEGAVYDMLDEEEKTKIEKEFSKNDEEGTEGSNIEENILSDGEGRELDKPLQVDANKDLKDNIQGDAKGNTEGSKVQDNGLPEGGGIITAPKAFEEVNGKSSSLQVDNAQNLLSSESKSITEKSH